MTESTFEKDRYLDFAVSVERFVRCELYYLFTRKVMFVFKSIERQIEWYLGGFGNILWDIPLASQPLIDRQDRLNANAARSQFVPGNCD